VCNNVGVSGRFVGGLVAVALLSGDTGPLWLKPGLISLTQTISRVDSSQLPQRGTQSRREGGVENLQSKRLRGGTMPMKGKEGWGEEPSASQPPPASHTPASQPAASQPPATTTSFLCRLHNTVSTTTGFATASFCWGL
jgi:hypothetical protein